MSDDKHDEWDVFVDPDGHPSAVATGFDVCVMRRDVRIARNHGDWGCTVRVPAAVLRALLGVPDVRAEIAAWLRSEQSYQEWSDYYDVVSRPLYNVWQADRIESWPLPAGTPDVAGALALLRALAKVYDRGPDRAVLREAIALLEGKGT